MSTTLETIPWDLTGARLIGYRAVAGKHLELSLILARESRATPGDYLNLYLIDVHYFGCLIRFLESYVDSTPGETPDERICQARLDGLVYDPRRFSAEHDLHLILRLEGAGFRFNCGAFKFTDPTDRIDQPVGRPDFQSKGECG